MATYTFDGSSSVSATKGDTVFISADPTTFTQATDDGSSVTLTFGSQTLTITGTTLVNGGLPNVFVTGGQFAYAGTNSNTGNSDMPATTGNVLSFLIPNGSTYTAPGGASQAASSKIAIFGGLGRSDVIDGGDTISIGGKGTLAVYANAGADVVTQESVSTSGFDSASVVTVYGQDGNDRITLTNAANTTASIFASGGSDADTISVVNTGPTTVFGGSSSSDDMDGSDSITFSGGGKLAVFGNSGADTIGVTADSTTMASLFGGTGSDKITAVGTKASIAVAGGEDGDTISVTNTGGATTIYGGISSLDSTDAADAITVNADSAGGGVWNVFGNAGADTITDGAGFDSTAVVSIYGGRDGDIVSVGGTNVAAKGSTVFVAGGEGSDTIAVTSQGATTIWGGISSSDSADANDKITVGDGSSGAINVLANGGDDTVSIGVLDTDTTNTATVYGGGGADSIVIGSQVDGREAVVSYGNDGADTFTVIRGTGRTITIEDFKASNGDQLKLTNLIGPNPGTIQVVAQSGFQTLQQALDAASNASGGDSLQNKVAAVVFAGSTYVVIEQSGAGFQSGLDQAIKLTGVTDLIGLVGRTTVSGTSNSGALPPAVL